jgi:hypothetical protein
MANYDIIDRVVVEKWGEEAGRAEVQAVRIEDTDQYEVRVCYYRDNGQFGQSAPTVSPDEETVDRVCDGIREMAEIARTKEREHRLAAIDELVQDIGLERATEILESEVRESERERTEAGADDEAGESAESE